MGYYTTYYAFGLPSFLVIIIALYLLFTGGLLIVLETQNTVLKETLIQAPERRLMLGSS